MGKSVFLHSFSTFSRRPHNLFVVLQFSLSTVTHTNTHVHVYDDKYHFHFVASIVVVFADSFTLSYCVLPFWSTCVTYILFILPAFRSYFSWFTEKIIVLRIFRLNWVIRRCFLHGSAAVWHCQTVFQISHVWFTVWVCATDWLYVYVHLYYWLSS